MGGAGRSGAGCGVARPAALDAVGPGPGRVSPTDAGRGRGRPSLGPRLLLHGPSVRWPRPSGHRENARGAGRAAYGNRWHAGRMGGAPELVRPSMHGRGGPLAAAERRSPPCGAGEGHLLLLTGEAGIGKTRLLQAMHELAAAQGFALWAAARLPPGRRALRRACCSTSGTRCRARSSADVADLGRALVDGPRRGHRAVADPGDAHRRRRLLVLDAADRLASLADDGPGAAGARGPALVRRAEPGGRRAPRPPAAVAAAAGGRHPAHRRAAPRRSRSAPGGPGCCCSGWPRRSGCPGWTSSRDRRGWCTSCCRGRAASPAPGRAGAPALGRRAAARRGARQRRRAGPPVRRSVVRAGDAGRRDPQRFARCSPAGHGRRGRRGRRPPQLRPRAARRGGGRPELGGRAASARRAGRPPVRARRSRRGWFGVPPRADPGRHRGATPRWPPRRALHARVAERGAAPPRARRRRLPVGPPRGRRAARRGVGRPRRPPPNAPRRCPRTRRRSTCCTGRCAACATTTSRLAPTCWPGGRPRPPPPTTTRRRRRTTRRRGTLLLDRGDRVAAAALLPGAGRRPAPAGRPAADPHRAAGPGLADVAGLADRRRTRSAVRAALLAAKAAAYLVDDRLDDAIAAGEEALAAAGAQDEQTRLNTAATLGSRPGLRRADGRGLEPARAGHPHGPASSGSRRRRPAATA